MTKRFFTSISLGIALAANAGLAHAACVNTSSFEAWLAEFKAEARAKGIAPSAIAALNAVTLDQNVINSDRRQGVFSQGFLEFSDRMVAKYRLERGQALMAKHKALFDKVEAEFGVPAPVIVAFWGLETDFGANNGKLSTLRSLATLAYDCRRPDKFRAELFDALRIIERGDLKPEEMRGPWAGEIGQTQFVPSIYYRYAMDYNQNGKADLIADLPDVLASTANYLKGLGWRKGEPWLREVRLPESMDWKEADIAIEHPVSQWAAFGVRLPDGSAPKGEAPASLLLPLGRNGPAFLAYRNFKVYLEWNQSLVYSTTAAYFATRLAGAPPVHRGRGVAAFTMEQTRELQQLLRARGYDIGEVDGKIGLKTREAVKKAQIKLGLPADSYPTEELLRRLQVRS